MSGLPRGITLDEWDARYAELRRRGMREPWYGGPLRRHAEEGDTRLERLRFDDSPAALRLWNFLLTEGDRLREAREAGKKIVGAMKDLGTVPVMAFSFPNLVAFYPDGAWWTPCLKERRGDDLEIADSLGIDESFCPVRAMLGAFVTGARFPIPDLLTCSVGATCDDFSAIAQRLESLGWPIMWWEIPTRQVGSLETALDLPGGFRARREQIQYVQSELGQVRAALEELAGRRLTDKALAAGIHASNGIRGKLADLRECVFSSDPCPFPALEMSIAEMLAIHFCSDRAECGRVLDVLLAEVRRRAKSRLGVAPAGAARVFWVNPVSDLRVMNLLEDCGGRLCGTDFMFCHALTPIPEFEPPMKALARTALADPMVGSTSDRAWRLRVEIAASRAEALVVSRIPGASHCATEGAMLLDMAREPIGIPAVEIEIPSVCDALEPTIRTRLEALVEAAKARRRHQGGNAPGSECDL